MCYIMEMPSKRNPSTFVFQVLAVICANIGIIGNGCMIGWTSPSLPILKSDASPLRSGPLTFEEAAWVGCVPSLAGFFGTIIFGIFSKYVGSKGLMMWCSLPGILSWILIYLATFPWHIIMARILGGLYGGGLFLGITVYVAEIASDQIRGRLSTAIAISFNTGILMGYIAGTVLSYERVPLIMVVIPTLNFIILLWLPHTPQFLLAKKRFLEAEQSLRFYRNCKVESDQFANANLEFRGELEKLTTIAQQRIEIPSVKLSDFLTSDAIRGMLIGPTLMAIAQFSGTFALSNYAATIFMESGSTFNPFVSSIITGSFQVIGPILASSLIDRLGRRFLLLMSTAGATVALIVTGTYSYLHSIGNDMSALRLVPVISLSAYVIFVAVGLKPVPYAIVSEVLPQKIRRIGVTVSMCSISVFSSIMLGIFPIMLDSLGLYGCVWIFALTSCFGFVFIFFVVPETNGINLDKVDNVTNLEMKENRNINIDE